jgi:antiphage defense system Thoeris ThsB-like protein
MARRTFFSFHYERDVWRASIVRNSSKMKPNIDPEWIDASIWEDEKKKGDDAVKRLIDRTLVNTTVTAVLIGAETSNRKYVKYEIDKSIEQGNGLLGIYIHNIEDTSGRRDVKGANPLPTRYSTYDWIYDNGYMNLGTWVDAAYDAR